MKTTLKEQNKQTTSSSTLEKMNLYERALKIAKEDKVDHKKVAYFQKLIDSKKYEVKADKIAEKLIEEEVLFSK